MVRWSAFLLSFLLLLLAPALWAEVVYVQDELRLGIRPQANSSGAPILVVTSGTRLEMLEHTGNFAKVRTDEGVEGWVNASFVSSDKPARLLLDEMQQAHQQLQQQLQETQAEKDRLVTSSEGELAMLGARLEQVVEHNAQLEQLLERWRVERQAREAKSMRWPWFYPVAAALGLFLLGLLLGYRWHRRRVAGRLGGLGI
jgi:SH3 domain protein